MIGMVAALALSPSNAFTARPIWSSGARSVWSVPCTGPGDYDVGCAGAELRIGDRRIRLGQGYLSQRVNGVRVLWARKPGQFGPDLVVLGNPGGSGGDADILTIRSMASGHVERLSFEDADTTRVTVHRGRAAFDLEYAIGAFPTGAHASRVDVPIPLVWTGKSFDVDFMTLKNRIFDEEDMRVRRATVTQVMTDALAVDEDHSGDVQVAAVQALAGLMLSGRADLAHVVLREAWPRDPNADETSTKLPGAEPFWAALCGAITRETLWTRFDLARLPHADLIEAGARSAPRPR